VILGSILTPLENLLTDVLVWFHDSIGLSWAWSIIALTIVVRIALVPLTVKQIHSMQRMQIVAPEIKAIQQKYKNDKRRQQEEMAKLWKEHGINPAASCLPLVAQLPIFFSLFYVLRHFESHITPPPTPAELGWLGIVPNITDTAKDHWSGILLIVLYVASQLVSALLTPMPDKTQRAIFIALPFVFVFFVINFPVGLILYWVTTNLWTVGQGIVTRRLLPKPQPLPTRSSRAEPATKEPPAGDGVPAPASAAAPAKTGSGQQKVRRRKKRGPQAGRR
jgi:YidC/Oxa1 family membrane protein insertase